MNNSIPALARSLILYFFKYNPATGHLYWKRNYYGNKKGEHAGRPDPYGRFKIQLLNKYYFEHRLVYILHNGESPEILDHINRDHQDNRIENLRAATRSGNGANRKSAKGSTSKYLGVSLSRGQSLWRAQITVKGQCLKIGCYAKEKDAAKAYNLAAQKHHGEFANLNTFNYIHYSSKVK